LTERLSTRWMETLLDGRDAASRLRPKVGYPLHTKTHARFFVRFRTRSPGFLYKTLHTVAVRQAPNTSVVTVVLQYPTRRTLAFCSMAVISETSPLLGPTRTEVQGECSHCCDDASSVCEPVAEDQGQRSASEIAWILAGLWSAVFLGALDGMTSGYQRATW
jgi:hypothetical protein